MELLYSWSFSLWLKVSWSLWLGKCKFLYKTLLCWGGFQRYSKRISTHKDVPRVPLSTYPSERFTLHVFKTETLPSAWEFFGGLLHFQQSFVSVSRLHLEKKGLCSLSVLICSTGQAGKPLWQGTRGVFSHWVCRDRDDNFLGGNFLVSKIKSILAVPVV